MRTIRDDAKPTIVARAVGDQGGRESAPLHARMRQAEGEERQPVPPGEQCRGRDVAHGVRHKVAGRDEEATVASFKRCAEFVDVVLLRLAVIVDGPAVSGEREPAERDGIVRLYRARRDRSQGTRYVLEPREHAQTAVPHATCLSRPVQ